MHVAVQGSLMRMTCNTDEGGGGVPQLKQLQKLRKGVGFLVNHRLAASFASWRQLTAPRRTVDPKRRALLHLLHRELARGWMAWHATWVEANVALDAMRKSLGHLLHRGSARGFGGWCEMVAARATSMHLLQKGASFLLRRSLARSWNGWAASVRRGRMLPEAELMARSEAFATRRRVGVAFRWLAERADTMRLVAAVVGRIQLTISRRLMVQWGLWCDYVVEGVQKQQRADLQLRKALTHMVHCGLAGAFGEWATRAARQGKGAASWQLYRQRTLRRGWSTWTDASAAIDRAFRNELRALQHLELRPIGRVWRVWKRRAGGDSDGARLWRKAVGFHRHREYARALEVWRESAAALGASLALMRKGIGYLRYRVQAAGFQRWLSGCVPAGASAGAAKRRALLHLVYREQSRGWAQWRGLVDERRAALALMRQGIGHLMHRELSIGLGRWRRTLQRDAAVLRARWQAGRRLGGLRAGWRRWHGGDYARATAAQQLAHRALSHARYRDVARALLGWRANASAAPLEEEELEQKGYFFWKARAIVKSFAEWRERQKEDDAAMQLTFASAASFLPIAALAKQDSSDSLTAAPTGAAPSGSPMRAGPLGSASGGARGASGGRRPASRPRMVFH